MLEDDACPSTMIPSYSPGSSPRKVVDMKNVTVHVASVDQRLKGTPWTLNDLWPKYPATTAFTHMAFQEDEWRAEKTLAEAANRLLSLNAITDYTTAPKYASVDQSLDPGSGSGVPKMDAALCFGGSNDPPDSWTSIAVALECKNRQEPAQAEAVKQLKRAAERIFGHQFRLFVWAISVFARPNSPRQKPKTNVWFQLHLYTRSGLILSRQHKLADNFGKFCQLLVGFARMSAHDLGWYLTEPDPHHFLSPFDTPVGGSRGFDHTHPILIPDFEPLTLFKILAVRNGIESRATTVLWCKTLGGADRIVKLTWLSKRRADRYEAIVRFLSKKLPSLPSVLYCGILSRKMSAEPITTGSILQLNTQTPLSLPKGWLDRRLFCVIEDRPGVTIEEELSLERLLRTCAEAVEQICRMEEIKTYHRDVSIGNIFTRREGQAKNPCGWLGDFDCTYADQLPSGPNSAIPQPSQISHEDDALSGTLPFMSEAVLFALKREAPYKQTGIDDLESLVWVLYWFFHHFKPAGYDNGWQPVPYKQDVASQTSVARVFVPTTVQSTSRKRFSSSSVNVVSDAPADVGAPSLSEPQDIPFLSGARCSPTPSANSRPTRAYHSSQGVDPTLAAEPNPAAEAQAWAAASPSSSLAPQSEPTSSRKRRSPDVSAGGRPAKRRPLQNEPNDPLDEWLGSYKGARTAKFSIKESGVDTHFDHWNSSYLEGFFDDIWNLEEWKHLSGANLERFRKSRPAPTSELSFNTLAKQLAQKFTDAASDARAFYKAEDL